MWPPRTAVSWRTASVLGERTTEMVVPVVGLVHLRALLRLRVSVRKEE